ncbi:mitochondrial carrier domain-containing protein [Pisolithus marmoratus]|nr:mitochondrial carrier domain-containing protein [Pisolithus marmoratus]
MAYDQWRAVLIPSKDHETNCDDSRLEHSQGLTSVTVHIPTRVDRVRMAFTVASQTSRHAHALLHRPLPHHRPVQRIYSTACRSLKFYRGFTVTMVGMIPYAGTAFLTWDFLRAHFYPVQDDISIRPGVLANLAIGAVSGAVAQTVSYPLEVTRRRMQVGGITRPDRWLGWGETVRAIYTSGGIRGFYVGLSVGYMKIIPMNGISFAVWQGCKWLMGL